tara:strand:+ start:2475 stop:2711 length:237 start_codon:yes stop_codon:yes gene_type:complete
MPTYLFHNTETGEEYEEFMTISERNVFVKDNPHITQLVNGAPAIGDPMRLGVTRIDDGFKNRLQEIKRHHPLATFNIP